MLKILIDPLYSLRDTRRCAAQFAMDQVCRRILEKYPEAFVYYITPGKECFVFEETLGKDFPGRVQYFSGHHLEANRLYQVFYRPDWFQNIVSSTGYAWDWDILLTMRSGMDLVRWLNCLGLSAKKKIVVHDQFPVFPFRPSASAFYTQREDHQLSNLTSYSVSDRVVLCSPEDVERTLKAARTYLSPALCKRLQDNLRIGWAMPHDLDLSYPLHKSPDLGGRPVTGIFPYRITSHQRPELVFDSFFYPFVRRPKGSVRFHISTNSLADLPPEWKKKYSFLEFYQASRSEFYEKLKQSDFFVAAVKVGSSSMSLFEAIASGCIPILYRNRWSEDLAGKDYRFLFDDLKEAVVHVNHILDHFQESLDYFKKWYEWQFVPFLQRGEGLFCSVEEMIQALPDEIEEYCRPRIEKPLYNQMVAFIQKQGWKKFTIFSLLKEMHKAGIVRVNPEEKGVGYKTQVHMGRWLINRSPRYFDHLHCLLLKTGWKRGLEPGGFCRG